MKVYNLLLLCFSLVLPRIANGQDIIYEAKPIAELPDESKTRGGEAYIFARPSTVKQKLNVYLINETDSNLTYQSFSGFPEFEVEAKNRNGVWEPIDRRTFTWSCGTGMRPTIIPPEHYSYRTYHNTSISDGTFETKLRFIFQSSDSTLKSNTVPVNIDYSRFKTQLDQEDEIELERNNSDFIHIENVLRSNRYNKLKYEYYDELINQMNSLMKVKPNNYEYKYIFAVVTFKKIEKEVDLSKQGKYQLVKKAMEELAKIPEINKRHEFAVKMIKSSKKYLAEYEAKGE